MMKYVVIGLFLIILLLNGRGLCAPAAGSVQKRKAIPEGPVDDHLQLANDVSEANSKSPTNSLSGTEEKPGKESKKIDTAGSHEKGDLGSIGNDEPTNDVETLGESQISLSPEDTVPGRADFKTTDGGSVPKDAEQNYALSSDTQNLKAQPSIDADGKTDESVPLGNTVDLGKDLKPTDEIKHVDDAKPQNTKVEGNAKTDEDQVSAKKTFLDGDDESESISPALSPSDESKLSNVEKVISTPITEIDADIDQNDALSTSDRGQESNDAFGNLPGSEVDTNGNGDTTDMENATDNDDTNNGDTGDAENREKEVNHAENDKANGDNENAKNTQTMGGINDQDEMLDRQEGEPGEAKLSGEESDIERGPSEKFEDKGEPDKDQENFPDGNNAINDQDEMLERQEDELGESKLSGEESERGPSDKFEDKGEPDKDQENFSDGNNANKNGDADFQNVAVASVSPETEEKAQSQITERNFIITTRSLNGGNDRVPPPITYNPQMLPSQNTAKADTDAYGYPTTYYNRQLQTYSSKLPYGKFPYNPYYPGTMFRPRYNNNYITNSVLKRLSQTTATSELLDNTTESEITSEAAEKPSTPTQEETTAEVVVLETTSEPQTTPIAKTVRVTTTASLTTIPEVTTSPEAPTTTPVVTTTSPEALSTVNVLTAGPPITTTPSNALTSRQTEATDGDVDSHNRKRPPVEVDGGGREGGSQIVKEDKAENNKTESNKLISTTSKPALTGQPNGTVPAETTDFFIRWQNYGDKLVKQLGALKVSLILLAIIGLSFLSIFGCCRICKRKGYRMRQRRLKEYGQEKEFLLRDRKGNKYSNDAVTLLEGSSEDEF